MLAISLLRGCGARGGFDGGCGLFVLRGLSITDYGTDPLKLSLSLQAMMLDIFMAPGVYDCPCRRYTLAPVRQAPLR